MQVASSNVVKLTLYNKLGQTFKMILKVSDALFKIVDAPLCFFFFVLFCFFPAARHKETLLASCT